MDGFNWKHIFLTDDFMASDSVQFYTDAATTKGFADAFWNRVVHACLV